MSAADDCYNSSPKGRARWAKYRTRHLEDVRDRDYLYSWRVRYELDLSEAEVRAGIIELRRLKRLITGAA